MDRSITHKEKVLRQLGIGTIFFAIRSCEYPQITRGDDSKRTNILKLRKIKF